MVFHQNVFELLVAVMLSAQTTDKKVNQVTASLFKKYPTVESFALASLEDLQDDIKIIGLYRNKAKNLKKMAQVLLEEYNGEVPKTRKELESLPGVGRKTTNVVLSVGFDEPAFTVSSFLAKPNLLEIRSTCVSTAMIYGPKKVIVIVGMIKIFDDEDSAIQHIKNISCPANALRLHKNTPCVQVGKCVDCQSDDRICSAYVKIARQPLSRMTVLVINEELGY